MNVIFARHDGCQKDFCWQVPDNLKNYISKSDILLVDTMGGLDIATAITGVISGDGARDIAENKGAYFPLKSVVSFANDELRRYIARQIKLQLAKSVNSILNEEVCNSELPF